RSNTKNRPALAPPVRPGERGWRGTGGAIVSGLFEGGDSMRVILLAAGLSLAALPAAAAQQKGDAACVYEAGGNHGKTVSDYEIWNMAAFPIPKGTVVSFTVSTAPGKTFTAKAPSDVAPHDSFPSGGTQPAGACKAWWMK